MTEYFDKRSFSIYEPMNIRLCFWVVILFLLQVMFVFCIDYLMVKQCCHFYGISIFNIQGTNFNSKLGYLCMLCLYFLTNTK